MARYRAALLTIGLLTLSVACGGSSGSSSSTPPTPVSPAMQLSAATLPFTAAVAGANPAAQAVTVSNSGGGTLAAPTTSVTYASGSGWLTVAAATGSAGGPYTLSVQPTVGALAAGSYGATVSVASAGATNTPQTFAVTLAVGPVIRLSATTLPFTGTVGGANPAAQAITVSNAGGGTLASPTTSVSYGSGSGWLTVAAPTGASGGPYTLSVQADITGLGAGTYGATVSVACAGANNTPQTLAVGLTVTPAGTPAIHLSTDRLTYTGTVGGANPAAQTVTVSNSGGGTLAVPTTSVTYDSGSGWLTVAAATGGTGGPYTLSVQPNIAGGTPGSYIAYVAVASAGASNTPQSFTVNLVLSAGGRGNVTEYGVPTASSTPYGIGAGKNGDVWFTENATSKIGCIKVADGTITEYAVPTAASNPSGMTAAPDKNGDIWFTEAYGNKLGRITPGATPCQGATITEFATGIHSGAAPTGITVGPDGNVWFTENTGNRIGVISIPGGTITEYGLPHLRSNALGITSGPDGKLWFTEAGGNRIGSITTGGTITEYAVTTASSTPQYITAGPDGNLWFTEYGANQVASISTSGTIVEYAQGISGTAWLTGITAGPDGASVWFTEWNRIARLSTVDHSIVEYPISNGSQSIAIALGPDGNLWFTESLRNNVGRITP